MSLAAPVADPQALECYADLEPWAAGLCEQGYAESLAHGRRRRAARIDFVAGWKQGARDLGRRDVFRPEAADARA